jgi:hypothetical protein
VEVANVKAGYYLSCYVEDWREGLKTNMTINSETTRSAFSDMSSRSSKNNEGQQGSVILSLIFLLPPFWNSPYTFLHPETW